MPTLELPFDDSMPPSAEQIKAKARAQREAERQAEEIEKNARRAMRGLEMKRRHETDVVYCGINCYFRRRQGRSWWTECHKCHQPLTYYRDLNEAIKHRRECGSQPIQSIRVNPCPSVVKNLP